MAGKAQSGKATANQNSQLQVPGIDPKYLKVNPESLAATNHQYAVRRKNSDFAGKEIVQYMLVTFPEPVEYAGGLGAQLEIRVMEADGSFRIYGADTDAPKDYMELPPQIRGIKCKWPVQPDAHINGWDLYAVKYTQVELKPETLQAEIQQHYNDYYDELNGVWMDGQGPLDPEKQNRFKNVEFKFTSNLQKAPLTSFPTFRGLEDSFTMSAIEDKKNKSAGVAAESEPRRGRGVRRQLTNRNRLGVAPAAQETELQMPAMGNLLQP